MSSKKENTLDCSLEEFLGLEESKIKDNEIDQLGFFELSEKETEKNEILLVQGIRGSGKSTFLKYCFWQKKKQVEQNTEGPKKLITISFTPWFFNKNDFYREFLGLLKSKLLQQRYSRKLDNAIDSLLETLGATDSIILKILHFINKPNHNSIEIEIQNIVEVIKKDYKDYHIMIAIDEIDRLHIDDLLELGKLIELIKNIHTYNKAYNTNIIFCRSNTYLNKLAIPGSIGHNNHTDPYTFEQYFSRFRTSKIDIYRTNKDKIVDLLFNFANGLFNNRDGSSNGTRYNNDIEQVINDLSTKDIAITPRSINQVTEKLKKQIQKLKDNISNGGAYEEIGLSEIVPKDLIPTIIYFQFIYLFKESLYRETANIVNKSKYIVSDGYLKDQDNAKNKITELHKSYSDKILSSRNTISAIIESSNPESLITKRKEQYLEQFIIEEIKSGNTDRAFENSLKYINDRSGRELFDICRKIGYKITSQDDEITEHIEEYLKNIINPYLSDDQNSFNIDTIDSKSIVIRDSIGEIIEKYENSEAQRLIEEIHEIIIRDKNLTPLNKSVIFLRFWRGTRRDDPNWIKNKYQGILSEYIDKKFAPEDIKTKDKVFSLKNDLSYRSSRYYMYQTLDFLINGFNSSGEEHIDEYIKSSDATLARRYIRFYFELFDYSDGKENEKTHGIFSNFDGFLDLISFETKLKLFFRCFDINRHSMKSDDVSWYGWEREETENNINIGMKLYNNLLKNNIDLLDSVNLEKKEPYELINNHKVTKKHLRQIKKLIEDSKNRLSSL